MMKVNQNLLFIAPIFFDYEKSITNILENRYEKVIFRSEVPFNSATKFYTLRRISLNLAQKALNRYSSELYSLIIKNNISKIFIIRGYGLQEWLLKKINSELPHIEIINYQWDSVQNNPNGLMIANYAQKNISFDLADVAKYSQFKHLPLFYDWTNLRDKKSRNSFAQDIDVMFVGGYHSNRAKIIDNMSKFCDSENLKIHSHIYIPFLVYIKCLLFGEKIDRSSVKFTKVSRKHFYELLCRSRIIIDIQSPTQSGATMRTIEALSVGSKLLSTNAMLQSELFYSPKNIAIWDITKNPDFKDLLECEFDHSKDSYLLSVEQWVDKLLN